MADECEGSRVLRKSRQTYQDDDRGCFQWKERIQSGGGGGGVREGRKGREKHTHTHTHTHTQAGRQTDRQRRGGSC